MIISEKIKELTRFANDLAFPSLNEDNEFHFLSLSVVYNVLSDDFTICFDKWEDPEYCGDDGIFIETLFDITVTSSSLVEALGLLEEQLEEYKSDIPQYVVQDGRTYELVE